MKIVVCLKEVVDSNLSLVFDAATGELFRKGLAFRLNPDDATALAQALSLKKQGAAPVEIALISIGPERVEHYLRDGLACGADSAVRIWGERPRRIIFLPEGQDYYHEPYPCFQPISS